MVVGTRDSLSLSCGDTRWYMVRLHCMLYCCFFLVLSRLVLRSILRICTIDKLLCFVFCNFLSRDGCWSGEHETKLCGLRGRGTTVGSPCKRVGDNTRQDRPLSPWLPTPEFVDSQINFSYMDVGTGCVRGKQGRYGFGAKCREVGRGG